MRVVLALRQRCFTGQAAYNQYAGIGVGDVGEAAFAGHACWSFYGCRSGEDLAGGNTAGGLRLHYLAKVFLSTPTYKDNYIWDNQSLSSPAAAAASVLQSHNRQRHAAMPWPSVMYRIALRPTPWWTASSKPAVAPSRSSPMWRSRPTSCICFRPSIKSWVR